MQKEYKQCLVLREDLRLSKGKTAVQAAHASVLSYDLATTRERRKWKEQGQKKVVLKAGSLEEIYRLRKFTGCGTQPCGWGCRLLL